MASSKPRDMTEAEIQGVFKALNLPLDGGGSLSAPPAGGPFLILRTTGYTPPLDTTNALQGAVLPSAQLERTP